MPLVLSHPRQAPVAPKGKPATSGPREWASGWDRDDSRMMTNSKWPSGPRMGSEGGCMAARLLACTQTSRLLWCNPPTHYVSEARRITRRHLCGRDRMLQKYAAAWRRHARAWPTTDSGKRHAQRRGRGRNCSVSRGRCRYPSLFLGRSRASRYGRAVYCVRPVFTCGISMLIDWWCSDRVCLRSAAHNVTNFTSCL